MIPFTVSAFSKRRPDLSGRLLLRSEDTVQGDAEAYETRMIATHEGITGCARCGTTHETLYWKRFYKPVEVTGARFTSWARCPETGDPILFEAREVT